MPERRVVTQHVSDQLVQRRAGLNPEFLIEAFPRHLEYVERVDKPAGAIERCHEMRMDLFAERILLDEFLQFWDQRVVFPEIESHLDGLQQ